MADNYIGRVALDGNAPNSPVMVLESGDYLSTKAIVVTEVAAKINHADHVMGMLTNESANTIYVGGPDVTVANGKAIAAGREWVYGKPDVYAVCAAGLTSAANVYEERANA